MIGVNLSSLPTEVYREIANNLNYNDYSNFRMLCVGTHEALYDDAMLKKITYNPSSSSPLRYRCNWLLTDKVIRPLLEHENAKDFCQALKSCVSWHTAHFGSPDVEHFVIRMDYKDEGALPNDRLYSIKEAINSLRKKMHAIVRPDPDAYKIPTVILHQQNSPTELESFDCRGLRFVCTSRVPYPVEDIFEALNAEFNAGPVLKSFLLPLSQMN